MTIILMNCLQRNGESLTVNILGEAQKLWILFCQSSQSSMSRIWVCFETYMATVAIKEPDKAGVGTKGLHGC